MYSMEIQNYTQTFLQLQHETLPIDGSEAPPEVHFVRWWWWVCLAVLPSPDGGELRQPVVSQ